ncbi:discoidin domain-containing receptor tyrosine kinase B-like [Lineus longissimus]|uniref:discoidin domain-containing receptor tyrosine kinase B-like n=1 Tax=Lineus longissimus TaxID=88925 RepID=UPI002B4E202A
MRFRGRGSTLRVMDTGYTFLLFLTIIGVQCVLAMINLDECNLPLGMESGDIPDEAISASSTYDAKSVSGKFGRVRQDTAGGAWCPKNIIYQDVYEYLQVEFSQLVLITKVETQGRNGQGHGKEYAEQYLLEYQRDNLTDWKRYKSRKGREMLNGNWDTDTAVGRELDPAIIAKRVRVVPYSRYHRTVCMRVEFHGCNWTEGLVSYNMQQGSRFSDDIDFIDYTYDGQSDLKMLSNGLGQLTDFLVGTYRITAFSGYDKKGYPWVGWKKRNKNENGPREILFTFDAYRRFFNMSIHCNSRERKGVKIFKKAVIYFSLDGTKWIGKPVEFRPLTFKRNYATWIGIPLYNRAAKYLKVNLYFHEDSRWMLISEVSFWSELLDDNSSIILSDVDTEWEEEKEKEVSAKEKPESKSGPDGPDDSNSQTLNSDVTKDNTKAPPATTISTTTERRRIVIHHKPRAPRTTTAKYFSPTLGGVAYESRDSDTVSKAPSSGGSQNMVLIVSVCVFVDLFRRV